jgi:hypothetical protein
MPEVPEQVGGGVPLLHVPGQEGGRVSVTSSVLSPSSHMTGIAYRRQQTAEISSAVYNLDA